MFCFTFVSDHNTDYIMLYSVQLKNMYSYLNSSLKLSDIVRGLSCQQSYYNLLSLYKLIIIFRFILSYNFFLFPSTSCLVLYRLTLMNHKGKCVVKHQTKKKHFNIIIYSRQVAVRLPPKYDCHQLLLKVTQILQCRRE